MDAEYGFHSAQFIVCGGAFETYMSKNKNKIYRPKN